MIVINKTILDIFSKSSPRLIYGRFSAILTFNRYKKRLLFKHFGIIKPKSYSKPLPSERVKLLKNLTLMIKSNAGRSTQTGHITVRHRGGGHSYRYRLIDFFRNMFDLPAVVLRTERDPSRNSFISLICYSNGVLSYIVQPEELNVGGLILSSKSWLPITVGNAMPLSFVPIGTFVHNIQHRPSKPMSFVRAAGATAQVLKKSYTHTLIRLPSSELRYFRSDCLATIGAVSNAGYKFLKLSKAGNARWLGRRPSVRGVAMNPIDHPHGGGQGKTSGGRPSVSLWSKLTKGFKTVKNKKNKLIFKGRV